MEEKEELRTDTVSLVPKKKKKKERERGNRKRHVVEID